MQQRGDSNERPEAGIGSPEVRAWGHAPTPGPQYQYIPFIPPPTRRGVSKGALTATAAGTLVLGLLIGYASGRASATKTTADANNIVTVPSGAHPASPAGHPSPAAAPTTASKDAKIGDAITLTGNGTGEKTTVTVVKVVDPATGSDEFMQPKTGYRFVAVQFRLANTGTTAYSDSPSNGAQLVDAQGQSFEADIIEETSAGPNFPGQVNITPGNTALGFVVFQVPTASKIALVQFGTDSGFGQKGQWKLH